MIRERRMPAGNTATLWLKIIALCFMFVDHAGKMLFPAIPELRMIGRIAFPIYAWCMVVGSIYTRSMPRYMLRILITGLISQPLYMIALNHTWNQPNIFLTLLLGLGAIWGIKQKQWFSHIWAPALALILATVLSADYGWKGVLLILLLYAARTSRPAIAAVMIAYAMYWGTAYQPVTSFFGLNLSVKGLPACITGPVLPFLRLEALNIFSLPFILIRFPEDLRIKRWISYAIYPAHLVILWLLEQII